MKNKIKVDKNTFISYFEEKKYNQQIRTKYYTSSKENIILSKLNSFEIECVDCKKYTKLKVFTKHHKNNLFLCNSCRNIGERNPCFGRKHSEEWKKKKSSSMEGIKNPFYGKTHSKEVKEKLSNISKKNIGEKNPFYGKTHNKETREIISKSNIKYNKNMSKEDKLKRSEITSKAVKKFQSKNPEYTKKIRTKARYRSHLSQSKRKYEMNKIEKKVFNKIKHFGFEYSVILGFKQYDFGLKKERILIEVQGDYWHGNPNIYKKEDLNRTQRKKQEADKSKKDFALKHGFKIFYIWEEEINNNSYTNLIKEIENEINI